MKKIIITSLVASVIFGLTACNSISSKTTKPKDDKDSLSYMIGISVGHTLKAQKIEGINAKLLAQGIEEVLTNDSAMSIAEANAFINEYFMKMAEVEGEKNLEKGEAFLAENKTKEGVVETESGLQYKVLVEGTGASPTVTDRVRCHYEGRLIDGTVFDSSYERGQPAEFSLQGVIRGWTEGLQLMKEGGKYELYVPADLAYGKRGGGQIIGPNETLIFTIELLEILPSNK